MKLSKLLKGCVVDSSGQQTINGMTVLPLVLQNPKFASKKKYMNPLEVVIDTNGGYGNVGVQPPRTDETLILPAHSYFKVDYAAQDHATSSALKLKKGDSYTVLKNSRCIQSNQGGSIRKGRAEMTQGILPMALREIAYNSESVVSMRELWPHIVNFNSRVGVSTSSAALRNYFQKYDSELDKFISHFENVNNLIGFITFYKGNLIAVDKFPNTQYAKWMWKPLIRDAYASLVIKDMYDKKKIPKNDLIIKMTNTIDKTKDNWAEELVSNVMSKIDNDLKEQIGILESMNFSSKKMSDPDISRIYNDGYIGHVVEDDGFNALVSIIKKDSFDPISYKHVVERKKLASSQDDFNLDF